MKLLEVYYQLSVLGMLEECFDIVISLLRTQNTAKLKACLGMSPHKPFMCHSTPNQDISKRLSSKSVIDKRMRIVIVVQCMLIETNNSLSSSGTTA